MDRKREIEDPDLELRLSLLNQSKRVEPETDLFKQLWPINEQSHLELGASNSLFGTSGNSQIRLLMSEAEKRPDADLFKETDAYTQLRRMTITAGGLANFSGISRLGTMFNDDFGLEKRASITDDKFIDVSLIKSGFTTKNSMISPSSMDGKKPGLADSLHPLLNRHKSNDSFAMMVANNFSNPQQADNNSSASKISFKNEYPTFGRLLMLLKKHFNSMEITEKDLKLSKQELEVMGGIITRKYKGRINTPTESYFLGTIFKDIEQLESNKRPEENYKFVFKRCIKFMKERLNAHEKKKMRKRQLEEHFYQYYFAEACKSNNMSMDLVKHPQKGLKSDTAPKTINAEYIGNVAKSREFVKDFNSYMYRFLQKDYELTVNPKLEGMVKRWEEIYSKAEDKQLGVNQIIEYVLKNKKCKLPWTGKEIDAAMESVRVIFADCCAPKQ